MTKAIVSCASVVWSHITDPSVRRVCSGLRPRVHVLECVSVCLNVLYGDRVGCVCMCVNP